ncbi:glycosyltransferase family 4 protein [Lysobacter sp. A286]
MKRSLAIVVNHFPGEGRLSGLVSFAKALVPALAGLREVTVYSGSRDKATFECADQVCCVRVHPFFWFRVWRELRGDTEDILILSGIHSPLMLMAVTWLMRFGGIRNKRVVYVQAVTLDRQLAVREARFLVRSMSKVAFLNPFEARRAAAVLAGAVYLKSGIDAGMLGNRSEKKVGAPMRIGFFGHLNEVKGADRLPSILGQIGASNWDCVIAGSGQLSTHLDSWVAAHGTPVQLFGYLKDPFELLRSCDLLVAPFRQSNTVLGISQVVLEALALGIPVVGSNVEAISAVIVDGSNGLLCDSDEQIADALGQLIVDEEMRNVLSAGARETASQYSIQQTALEIIGILEAAPAGNAV